MNLFKTDVGFASWNPENLHFHFRHSIFFASFKAGAPTLLLFFFSPLHILKNY